MHNIPQLTGLQLHVLKDALILTGNFAIVFYTNLACMYNLVVMLLAPQHKFLQYTQFQLLGW